MDEHILHDALGGQDLDCVTDIFLSQNQQHSVQIGNAQELPMIMGPNIYDSVSINRDHMYNLELKPMGLKDNLLYSNDVSSKFQSGYKVVSQDQMTDGIIGVEIQENENEGETLVVDVDESGLMSDDLCENDVNIEQDYARILDVIQFIREKESSTTADFVAVPSDKSKNPPYLIKDTINIITKNNEPIKFCLQGAASDMIVTLTMQYTEEKFKNNPVLACKLDQKDEDAFPFLVSPAGEEIVLQKDKINEHLFVHFTLPAENVDLENDGFVFHVTVMCLNSCHKSNGKKIQLVMKLLDPQEKKIIKETRFNIRACKNVKRDYKEAFLDGETSVKQPKPDSFVGPIESQTQPCIVKEGVKPLSRDVDMVVTKPPVQMVPEKKVITCTTTKCSTPNENERKFYLVQLPTAEKEKNVLQTVKLLGGRILNLETVYPVHEDDTNSDLLSSP